MRQQIGRLALVALLTATACDDESEPTRPATDRKTPATPPVPATAKPAAGQSMEPAAPIWEYSPVGKRDPFRSYLAAAEREAALGQQKKKREATEEFELDQYRLTALITGTAQPKAMVEDPQGRGHTLRIGSRLGRNGGRVTRITSLGMTVTEEIRTPTGERVRVPIQILLPRPEQDLRIEP